MQNISDEQDAMRKPSVPQKRRWLLRLRRSLIAVVTLAVALGALVVAIRRYEAAQYPYGWSHCCDTVLMLALHKYAEERGGNFPTGEATPEASLSLLYPKYIDANTLRGKTVPLEVVEKLLERGKRLTPETCGWHYVDGLTNKDDGGLALLWDKVGLDHNGRLLPHGGHQVLFVDLDSRYVPEAEWADFLKHQAELLATRKKK